MISHNTHIARSTALFSVGRWPCKRVLTRREIIEQYLRSKLSPTDRVQMPYNIWPLAWNHTKNTIAVYEFIEAESSAFNCNADASKGDASLFVLNCIEERYIDRDGECFKYLNVIAERFTLRIACLPRPNPDHEYWDTKNGCAATVLNHSLYMNIRERLLNDPLACRIGIEWWTDNDHKKIQIITVAG